LHGGSSASKAGNPRFGELCSPEAHTPTIGSRSVLAMTWTYSSHPKHHTPDYIPTSLMKMRLSKTQNLKMQEMNRYLWKRKILSKQNRA